MKILFVANRMPFPPFRGDKLKIYNLAKALSKYHELDLITIAESKQDIESVNDLEIYFKSIDYTYVPKWKSYLNVLLTLFSNKPFQVGYFNSKAFKNKLENKLKHYNYDAIHVQHLRMSQFIPKNIMGMAVLDLPDAFSMYWKRRYLKESNIFLRQFNRIEHLRLAKFEKKIIPKFNKTLVCSVEDQKYLEKSTNSPIKILQNGVDIETFFPDNRIEFKPQRILFTGNMDYAPNIDAVEYFTQDIFPSILKNFPNSQFIIAGQRPVSKVKSLESKNIQVLGFIENLTDEYRKAHLVVSPLRIGAGTQNKVLESLACGVPVVSTYIGYAGLELPDKESGVLPSSNSDEFILNVNKILSSTQYRNQLSEKGMNHIIKNFSWKGISIKLENYLKVKT